MMLAYCRKQPNGVDEKGNKRRTHAEDQPPRDRLSSALESVCLPFANETTGVVEADEQVGSVEGDTSLSLLPSPSPLPA